MITKIPPAPERPQCQEPFDHSIYHEKHREWRAERMGKSGKDPDCCNRGATHIVNGVPLCRKHAGDRALQILCPPLPPSPAP